MPESPERTALYRYFDASDDLLYIGISNDPDFRWKAHLYGSDRNGWPSKAVRRAVEWFASRPLALAAEAIRTECPRHNGAHNYDDAPFNPNSWAEASGPRKVPVVADLMRSEIASGHWSHGQRIPSLRTLAAAAGVSIRIVSKASVALQAEGLLDLQPGRGLFVARQQHTPSKLPHDWFRQFGFPG
jgi:predicted GIY-YIG superfamily endonuclease